MIISLTLFMLIFTIGPIKADKCITPNNETAQCLSLYSCPILLQAGGDPTKRDFIRKSNCGGTPFEPMVCCGSHSNFTQIQKIPRRPTPDDLLPSRKVCGLQHSDDYYHTINDTSITEFPWLAIIIRIENLEIYFCTGTLINNKYVLTSAECVFPTDSSKLTGIRLGEYHFDNNTDCVEDSQIYECSEAFVEFGIEKVITHPNYTKEKQPTHDIALIRLNKTVQYSDYIRPICLPKPETKRPKPGDILIQSGWAGTGPNRFFPTGVKKRVPIRLINNKECENLKFLPVKELILTQSGICGFSVNRSIIVTGSDTGGPLMRFNNFQWYQKAVASDNSFSVNIYVLVVDYLDWIKENLEP